MSDFYSGVDWVNHWATAITTEPYSRESITSRLNALLDGKPVGDVPGKPQNQPANDMLVEFVRMAEWEHKPEAFDAVWHAIFDIAKVRGCTELIRDQTYYWTENFLLNLPWDTEPAEDGDEDDGEEYANTWIVTTFGDARLFALGYGYSAFAWNALIDGLGLGGEGVNSDSMRIGSCAQLLAGGQRIKLHLLGRGDEYPTKGFAGGYLQAQPANKRAEWEKGGMEMWNNFLKALEAEQSKAGPRAATLLKRTLEHLQSETDDFSSVEAARIIWPKA